MNEGPIVTDGVGVVLDIWEQSVGLLQHWHTPREGANRRGLAGVKGGCAFPLRWLTFSHTLTVNVFGQSNKGMCPCGRHRSFRSPSCVLGNRAAVFAQSLCF